MREQYTPPQDRNNVKTLGYDYSPNTPIVCNSTYMYGHCTYTLLTLCYVAMCANGSRINGAYNIYLTDSTLERCSHVRLCLKTSCRLHAHNEASAKKALGSPLHCRRVSACRRKHRRTLHSTFLRPFCIRVKSRARTHVGYRVTFDPFAKQVRVI